MLNTKWERYFFATYGLTLTLQKFYSLVFSEDFRLLKITKLQMLTSLEKIERYIQNIKLYDEFVREEIVADAVIKNLEIIGEAARNLPNKIYEKYPEILWKNIVGLRNIVTHGYFVVDLEIIWTIVTEQIPKLKKQLEAIMEDIQ